VNSSRAQKQPANPAPTDSPAVAIVAEQLGLEPEDVVVVLGVRGTGKSFWAKQQILREHPRVVVYDPNEEYVTGAKGAPPNMRQLTPMHIDQFIDHMATTLAAERGQLAVAVHSPQRTRAERVQSFERFVSMIGDSRNLLLVIEETGDLPPECNDDLCHLARRSRHWGIPVVFIAQRATDIPKTAREQMSYLVSFRQSDPADVRAIRERIGPRADAIANLPRRVPFVWHESEAFDHAPQPTTNQE